MAACLKHLVIKNINFLLKLPPVGLHPYSTEGFRVEPGAATMFTNSHKLGDINYSYIDIVGQIGFGICNLLMGSTIFAVKEM